MIDYKLDLNTGVVIEREILENIVYVRRNQDESITINERKHTDEELENLGYVKVVLEDKYLDYKAEDFNEDLTFSVEKYNARKQQENNQIRISKIQSRLDQLSQDLIQAQAGAVFEDLEERKAEFQTLHNELRVLLCKSPREYK